MGRRVHPPTRTKVPVQPLVLMERELPFEAMHSLVDTAGRDGATAFLALLRDVGRGRFRPTARGEAFFLAWHQGALVGLLALVDGPHTADARVGTLRGLYVTNGLRRRGIGRSLVSRALRHAQSSVVRVRIVDPTTTNGPFYAALGFKRATARHTYEAPTVR